MTLINGPTTIIKDLSRQLCLHERGPLPLPVRPFVTARNLSVKVNTAATCTISEEGFGSKRYKL